MLRTTNTSVASKKTSEKGKQSNTCHTFDTLKLSAFLDALFDEDYSGLVRAGSPSQTKIIAAWGEIFSRYQAETCNDAQRSASGVLKELMMRRAEYQMVTVCVQILSTCYIHTYAEELREMGYKFNLNPEYPLSYRQELKKIETKVKQVKLRIAQLENQLKAIKLPEGSAEKGSRSDFDKVLAALSEMQGHLITAETITVAYFVALIQRQKEKAETVKNKRRG